MKSRIPRVDKEVAEIFNTWQPAVRQAGVELRKLIFATANELPQIGPIEETLKWHQPAYLTPQCGSGSTIRLGETGGGKTLGFYFHCQTTLVETFRNFYTGQLKFEKNRAILLNPERELPVDSLSHCISLALTYHLKK